MRSSKTKILVYNNDSRHETNCFLLQFPLCEKLKEDNEELEEVAYELEMILLKEATQK